VLVNEQRVSHVNKTTDAGFTAAVGAAERGYQVQFCTAIFS